MPIVNGSNRRRRDGSKTERFDFRMTREDMQKLEETSQKTGKDKSDVLRDGIELAYLKAKYAN